MTNQIVPTRTFSNASFMDSPDQGGPNGGYLAKLLLEAATARLELMERRPRVVNVQFISSPSFAPLAIDVELLRHGGRTSFVSARMSQGSQSCVVGQVCYGQPDSGPNHQFAVMPAALDPNACRAAELPYALWPHFSQHCEYRIVVAPAPFSGAQHAEMLCWIRLREMPLDAGGLLFLFDSMFPAFFLAAKSPVRTVTTDLNVIFSSSFQEHACRAWVLVRIKAREWVGGWCIEDATAWSSDGLLLGVARQMRRVFGHGRNGDEFHHRRTVIPASVDATRPETGGTKYG